MTPGRKRTFCQEDALDQAMKVFWSKGYSGTSLSDLTTAMDINKPSLYAAFGNKETLFVSCIQRYVQCHGVPHFKQLETPGKCLRDRLIAYLESIASMTADASLPGGCFIVTSSAEAGGNCLPASAVDAIHEINAASAQAFTTFFEQEQKLGNLSTHLSPELLVDHLVTLQFGIAAMARNGVPLERLKKVIRSASAAF